MTDRELLELAAKAAGIKIEGWDPDYETYVVGHPENGREGFLIEQDFGCGIWNPLKDDGDALRLAFVVGLKVDAAKREVWYCKTPVLGKWLSIGWVDGIEGLRQAIVRAAAEIGKTLPRDPERFFAEAKEAIEKARKASAPKIGGPGVGLLSHRESDGK